jgi:hypothetical protein
METQMFLWIAVCKISDNKNWSVKRIEYYVAASIIEDVLTTINSEINLDHATITEVDIKRVRDFRVITSRELKE